MPPAQTLPGGGLADALFSPTRKAVIAALFTHAGAQHHLRELARLCGKSAGMVGRELQHLVDCGLVQESRDGNRREFWANEHSPIYAELRDISRKTFGLADVLRGCLMPLKEPPEGPGAPEGISLCFVYGSVARNTDHARSDIDVMLVGQCDYASACLACHEAGLKLGREVNPSIYTVKEIQDRLAQASGFMRSVARQPKIMLWGDKAELDRLLGT